jgi:hypothetical protein
LSEKRYFAIVKRIGSNSFLAHAHDYYPQEKAAALRYWGQWIIGDFASADEAKAAMTAEMDRRCDVINRARQFSADI